MATPHPSGSADAPTLTTKPVASAENNVLHILLSDVIPNTFQPRKTFDQAALAGLADSIRSTGVLQPVVVRPAVGALGKYELVAGERRWRAAGLAGLTTIPALVRDVSDEESSALALVENVQREDLNPVERARAFKRLCEAFAMSHADLAQRLGLDRSSVANMIRLNELEEAILDLISRNLLSGGHGKALLMAPAGLARVQLAKEAAERSYSVRRVEYEARRLAETARGAGAEPSRDALPTSRQAVLADLEKRLSQALGTKVIIRTDRTGKRGQITAEFYGLEHFDDLLRRLGVRPEGA